jgi:hypothetical protein
MTDDQKPTLADHEASRTEEPAEGDAPSWLLGALRDEPPTPDVLAGVQKKLRERSGGKFYADVWSTSKQPPILTFFVTSALMLVVILVAYAILAPLRGTPAPVRTEPAPVDVIAPAR